MIVIGKKQFKSQKLFTCFSFIALSISSINASFAVEQSNIHNVIPDFSSSSASSSSENPTVPFNNSSEGNFIPRRRFSLYTCFTKAAENNKEIAVAATNLPIAQAGITIAKAIPNPTYNLSYGFGPAWAYVIAGNNQQFGWNEEIQVAAKRTKKTALPRANYRQIFFQIESVRFNIHNRVRRSYTELAVASAYAKLIRAQGNIAQKLLDIAQKRFNAGKAPGSEVLQAKLNLMQFETQTNLAQARLVQDSAQLALLIGETPVSEEIIGVEDIELYKLLAGKSGLVPDPALAAPALDKLLPVAWQKRNDLKEAIQQAYTNRKALTLAKSQRIPDPFVGFNYLFSTYKPFQQQYFTPQLNARQVPYQPGYLITAASEMPIFYQHQGEVNQAKATLIQQLKQNDQLSSQIATDVITAY